MPPSVYRRHPYPFRRDGTVLYRHPCQLCASIAAFVRVLYQSVVVQHLWIRPVPAAVRFRDADHEATVLGLLLRSPVEPFIHSRHSFRPSGRIATVAPVPIVQV